MSVKRIDEHAGEKLRLPPIVKRNRSGLYGAYRVAAEYAGFRKIPYHYAIEWQHSWVLPEQNIHPYLLIETDKRRGGRQAPRYLVTRQDQQKYLSSEGYRKVYAVGHPLIYLPPITVPRIKNSLLVMPAHSSDNTPDNHWAGADYAAYIQDIAKDFSYICICVHPSCIRKNNWVRAFKELGLDIVAGAHRDDSNALPRLATLMSQFEYMTTNSFGSHLAYGSYFGCKVSLAGPRAANGPDVWKNAPVYKDYPEAFEIQKQWFIENRHEKFYPRVVTEPVLAKTGADWGAWQLGLQCKRSAKELRAIAGFGMRGVVSKLPKIPKKLVSLAVPGGRQMEH